MINVLRGLTQVEPSALELMRSYAASEAAIVTKLRIPNALPYFFTGAEDRHHPGPHRSGGRRVLRRPDAALGRVVVQSASALRFDVTWAAILVVSIAGIDMYLVVVALERVADPVAPVAARRAAGLDGRSSPESVAAGRSAP